ncbi:MAG: YqiJ family protein [Alphaproteobacteria bacterium]|nr:YqiJ family protein [Alphaproteobacteria bacterium]
MLFLEGNTPFLVALAIMLGIAVLEGVTTLLGGALSQVLENFLPESAGDIDLDADADADFDGDIGAETHSGGSLAAGHAESMEIGSANALSRLLGWLQVGRVPLLVLLVAFLTVFGLSGLIMQALARALIGTPLPAFLVAIPAVLTALPGTRVTGRILGRLIPSDETSVVSRNSFVGRVATITMGTATRDHPAEARLTDEHGQSHYMMVEPDDDAESFAAGEQVLLVVRRGGQFRAIRSTSDALVDE